METFPKTIDSQLYFHYTQLTNWEKNEKARAISTANKRKLHDDLLLNGVEDQFIIGKDGTVYDGNNRLKMIKQLIEEEQTLVAGNGADLAWIPVLVKEAKTEQDKWRFALKRNEQFAHWDEDGLSSYEHEWEDLDIGNINIDFFPTQTIEEQLQGLEKPKADTPEDTSTLRDKEIECPACKHKFIPFTT